MDYVGYNPANFCRYNTVPVAEVFGVHFEFPHISCRFLKFGS